MNTKKIASSNTSHLEAHAGFFRLLMKGIFVSYLLWPFDKKLISYIVALIRTHDCTVYDLRCRVKTVLALLCSLLQKDDSVIGDRWVLRVGLRLLLQQFTNRNNPESTN